MKANLNCSGRLWLVIAASVLAGMGADGGTPAMIRGNLGIHDPSTVIKCKNLYYIFGTGQGILSKSSPDHVFWTGGPSVFASPPPWTTNAVPGFTGFFWAPDIIFLNNQYYLYYAVSTFGSQVSAIGLATNPTLDPGDPSYLWTDQGVVIQSSNGSLYNTIDPSVTFDASGRLWMSFGSYWQGIYLIQLDLTTGKRVTNPLALAHLANNSSIEASCIFQRNGYYYLFVDWGTCCSGVDSTYNIRVGRSTSINGTYLDRSGVNMLNSGGSLFLQGTGKYIGPGHMGILSDNGTNCFTYHYYDANNFGTPTLDVEPLSWTSDNWPAFTNDWSAIYNFQADARDDNGQYYGMLEGGASIQTDATRGPVLNLSGASQYVTLPTGVGFARTFCATIKWNGGAAWQRIFDFGQGTNDYFFLTPAAASGKLRFAITTNGMGGEKIIESQAALPTNVWTAVAVTLNGSQGMLYLNGSPIATNASLNLEPLTVIPATNYLGRSQYPADPYFNGQIANVSIFGRALSAAEIAIPPTNITQPAGRNWSAFYSFTTNANDAGGQFNGTLTGGASVLSDAQRGPVLNLSGGSQYVSLPAPVGGAQTISGWVKWNGGAAWQRFFDFGVDTLHYLFFTPSDNNGKPHLGISAESSGERVLTGPNAFPLNTWTHVAAVFDGRESILYLNGSVAAVNNTVNLLPSDVGATHNYFGKSQFADPYFNGRLDSVRLSSLPLAPEDIFSPRLNLAPGGGDGLSLSMPAWAAESFTLQTATNTAPPFAWVAVTNLLVVTNDTATLTLPAATGAHFFRLNEP